MSAAGTPRNRRRRSRCATYAERDQVTAPPEMARADNSQFDLNTGLLIGRMSALAIDPQHPGDFARDLLIEVDQHFCELVEFSAAFEQRVAWPVSKKTSD